MPLTFIDIEKQKNWRIWLLFLFLMLVYFIMTAVFAAIFLTAPISMQPRFLLTIGLLAFSITGVHFWLSAYDTVAVVSRGLNAQQPDRQDDIHKVLMNVLQEIHVVTGNRRTMQCMVIPSLSMNALAVADLRGEAVIGITEGLLSRLTRPQLEAVIAHEAHHILSGDCLQATIAASLFGAYASAIENLGETSRGGSSLSPALCLAWGMLQLSSLLNMFISREREYRADAASVRMTRNPIALAETLYLLSRSWRGAGFIGSGYEMLCIINPQATALDEQEGFWADLFSTHPPVRKRIDVLLKMAHASIAELDARFEKEPPTVSEILPAQRYYAMDPQQQWQGPFSLAELGAQPWISPLTWISNGNDTPADRAWKDPLVNALFASRLSQQEPVPSEFTCPACKQPLVTRSYEDTQIYQCRFCSGILVDSAKIPRIIARSNRDSSCPDRISALARTVVRENQLRYAHHRLEGGNKAAVPLLPCSKCGNPMFRGFYSQAYLIEIDRCSFCGLTWFDRNELEMLQCLIENRTSSDVTGMTSTI